MKTQHGFTLIEIMHTDHKPGCPAGGAYTLGSVEQPCTCDVPRHARTE